MDLIKAVLYTAALIAATIAVGVIIAAFTVFAGYAILILIVWFVIKVVKEDPPPSP